MMMSNNQNSNQRILFITDDCPNIGKDEKGLRAMAERAFVDSNGTIGITYVGVGLSFNVHVSEELSKVRGTTIFSVTTSRELKQTLVDDFNYLVSPVATDVTVSLDFNGYEIEAVYGGDSDALQGKRLLNIRTLTSSAISEKGVKGAAILIKLKEREQHEDQVKIEIEYTPYISGESVKKIFEGKLVDEKNSEIQKAIMLGIFTDVMKDILPKSGSEKDKFTLEDKEKLEKLKSLIISQPDQIRKDLSTELDLLERLLLL